MGLLLPAAEAIVAFCLKYLGSLLGAVVATLFHPADLLLAHFIALLCTDLL
jgi:hypothetical protein